MIGKVGSKNANRVCALVSIAALLSFYTYLSHERHRKNPDDRTIPTWSQLWEGVVFLCQKPDTEETSGLLAAALEGTGLEGETEKHAGFLEGRILWEASKATLARLLGGLALGLAGGVLFGVLMGCFPLFDAGVSPVMYFASRIIPTAAMPIFFTLAGIELKMYLAMIAFGSMPIVTLTVSQYVREFPEELRYKAYTLGASHAEVITTAIFPHILPKVIDLAVLMIGPALVYLIAAEQIATGEGFGYRIRVLSRATRFEVVYPLIIILTVYAGAITCALKALQRFLCPWYLIGRR
jgi:NitT/TauT family transport system permease protein